LNGEGRKTVGESTKANTTPKKVASRIEAITFAQLVPVSKTIEMCSLVRLNARPSITLLQFNTKVDCGRRKCKKAGTLHSASALCTLHSDSASEIENKKTMSKKFESPLHIYYVLTENRN
jgi:hypothetical protein